MTARIAILWHLHQPEYRHPVTGRPVMPWTRLHALRGYRDMFVEAAEHGPRWTLNVVPSLLDQLDQYAEGGTDDHLDLTVRPADTLVAADLRDTFVGGHPRLVAAHPPWARLAARLSTGDALNTQDLRDVQVWSTLSWFGATAQRDHPVLAELIRKGVGFTEADKAAMLDAQRAMLADLPARIARVAGTPTGLSVTPYHHPILPLLVNVQHARRCGQLPPSDLMFAHPDDALAELTGARRAFEARFGRPVHGLWPSEGAVSPEVASLAAQAGFRWLATDEGVLHRSGRTGGVRAGAWELPDGVRAFFRDHELSDRIGFRYQDVAPEVAVADLLGAARDRGGLCVLALDGENPWEAYPSAGAPFRAALMRALEPVGITLDEAAEAKPVGRVSRLHTGSWIGADLQIWCGDAADHAAWRLLAAVRDAVGDHMDARRHVAAAAGSDWFWWFGPEFSTPFAASFDALFRAHLRRACEAAGVAPPAALDHPVSAQAVPAVDPPAGVLPHELHRRWAHWRAAGTIRWPRGGSMAGASPLDDARFGWDDEGALWLCLRWRTRPPAGAEVTVHVGDAAVRHVIDASPHPPVVEDAASGLILRVSADGPVWVAIEDAGRQSRTPPEGTVTLQRPRRPGVAWWSV